MPLRELHRQVAAIALRAAARHGFALGGGNALIAYGVISRPTQDVDLVTNRETGVGTAAGPVPFGLAVSLQVSSAVRPYIYDQIRERLRTAVRVQA